MLTYQRSCTSSMDTQKTTKETTVKSAIISTKFSTKYRVLRTIFMSHDEYETLLSDVRV